MKQNIKYLFVVAVIMSAIFAACKKDSVPSFTPGSNPVLAGSVTSIAASPADSLSNVVVFSWTDPKYATTQGASKYIIELDSSSSFLTPVNFIVNGNLSDTLTAKQINDVLLGFGFSFNVSYPVYVKIISSYANNNEQLSSNTITIQMTPYKIPPKVPVPANLYIVGQAVDIAPGNSWNTPVDTPYQKFTQIDSVTFGGIFHIDGAQQYLLLPVANSFDNKYAIVDNTIAGASAGGSFQAYTSGGENFPAPATSGWYKIVVNFQTGTYSVIPYTGPTVPLAIVPAPPTLSTGLWIIGDATPENPSWTNDSVSLAAQKFTQVSNGDFKITIALHTGGYLFLPAAGDWNNKYGGASATGGTLLFNGDVPGSNTPGPATSGNYLIDVNFVTGSYTVTPQ